jgi:L-fuculose-phosphate aldolase
LARYGTPGTPELSDALAPLVGSYDAILMANHGVVTYGQDLLQAYMRMETVEHFARISLVSHLLGRQALLSREEVEKLSEARQRYFGGGGAPVAPLTEACPVTADGRMEPPAAARERFWVSREELEALIDEAVKSAKVR